MGWTYTHRDKGTSNKEWFSREMPSLEILADSTIGGTWYAAARRKDTLEEGEMRGEVFALIFPVQWVPKDYYNFGYKDMDETVGPNESAAPAKVLDLLTPTDSEWANEWRQRCRDRLAKKLTPGQRVRFASPISFTNGAELSEFEYQGRNKFLGLSDYVRYNLSGWQDRAFEIIEREAA